MSDQEADGVKPRTVKGIQDADWDAFTKAARRANLTMGEWIVRAGHAAIQEEREADHRFAPGDILPPETGTDLVIPGQTSSGMPWAAPPANLPSLPEIMEALKMLAELTGEPLPGDLRTWVQRAVKRRLIAIHRESAPRINRG